MFTSTAISKLDFLKDGGFYFVWLGAVDLKQKYDSTLLRQITPLNSQTSIYALIHVAEPAQQPGRPGRNVSIPPAQTPCLRFIISTPEMIFGYGPLHAQHDFHSSNLNTEHWMTSEGLASIIRDRERTERKSTGDISGTYYVPCVLFLNLIFRKTQWRAALLSSATWV